VKLVPTADVGSRYKKLFNFPFFNAMQSSAFHSVFETDENLVIAAPTSSGKTVIFELAAIRLLKEEPDAKMVYIAPTKSLCSERFLDWQKKFQAGLQIQCAELTGDTAAEDWATVRTASIIVTTPEKWDSSSRSRAINVQMLNKIRLICIDELHVLNEDRGAVLEVVVSRMKALSTATRFVAVSATCPNTDDVGSWIGGRAGPGSSAKVHSFGPEFRPCPLKRSVAGFKKHFNQ
jgi:ATP-dependent DNA helicase HFM1/MER3